MRIELSARQDIEANPQRRLILTKPIRELPAETDEQIGYEFRRLRVASGLSANRLASTLGVSVRTLEDLEKGALTALPERRRAERLVTEYCRIARLDQRPLLGRLKAYAATHDVKRGQARWAHARRRRYLLRGAGMMLVLVAAAGMGVAIVLWPETARGLTAPVIETVASWANFALSQLKALLATGAR